MQGSPVTIELVQRQGSRQLTVTQAGLGDRVSRVAKGYTFFYGDKAGEHPLPSLLPSLLLN